MGVEVVTSKQQGVERKDTYAESTSFHLQDAHLVVTKWDSANHDPQAIYAPGTWIKVRIVGSDKS